MKTNRFFKLWLFIALGLTTAVFSSCKKDNETEETEKIETSISLDKTSLVFWIGGTCSDITLTATVEPFRTTNVTWKSSNDAVITVDNTGKVSLVGNNAATAVITATAGDKTATCEVKIKTVPACGVLINNVVWATCNVNAPGAFASTPQSPGMIYQWGRKCAHSATGGILGWDSSLPKGSIWEVANDPSPVGFRVPTYAEIGTLLETGKVTGEWTTQEGVTGCKFSDIATGNSIFLPAAGYREGGTLSFAGTGGYYWSSTENSNASAYCLTFINGCMGAYNGNKTDGHFIRCVAE